jgi:hypothetical protein
MYDLHNNIKVARSISPLTQTNADTAIVGQIVDHQGYESAEYIIPYGAITDVTVTFATLLEEGNDSGLSDAAAAADADLLGTEAGATPLFSDDNKTFKLGYKGTKRYTRLTITPTGNDAGAVSVGAVCVLSNPRLAPQSTQMT